jgi:hypothetical protein
MKDQVIIGAHQLNIKKLEIQFNYKVLKYTYKKFI